jgi:putative peptidoglycan lipid II flippase
MPSQTARFAAIFAGGTLISRVLGLIRDGVLAAIVPGAARDAFLVAFRLPNMLRDLIGEGAANAAFVPIYSETIEKESDESFRELVRIAMGAMILLLGGLTVAGVLIAPALLDSLDVLKPITGGEPMTDEYRAQLVTLGRWLFPYLFFIGLAVFAMGALFSVGHYSTPSWSPALLNVAIIACCLLFYRRFSSPEYALVLGVWLGGIAQLVVNYAALYRYTGVLTPKFSLNHPKLMTIGALLGPVLVGQSAGEVNKLVDALFAASLADNSVTVLYYANRLVQLPLALFGLGIAAAVLPSASRASAGKKTKEVRRLLMQALRQAYFLIAPAALGLAVLGEPIIRLLFERGEFSAEDTRRTAVAMTIFAAGLISFAGVRVGVTGFFAAKDTRTPVIVSACSMVLNIVLNFVLVGPLGYVGLALSTAISFTVNFVAIYVLLGKMYGPLWDGPFITAIVRMTVATAAMGAVAHVSWLQTTSLLDLPGLGGEAAAVIVPVAAAIVTFAGASFVLGIDEFRDFLGVVRRRLKR